MGWGGREKERKKGKNEEEREMGGDRHRVGEVKRDRLSSMAIPYR